jgi:hypothetical protein
MPDRLPFARDNAPNLLALLTEVRDATPDARDFAWFDRRDDLMRAGVPRVEVDGFDARDSAALNRKITETRAAASGSDAWPAFADAGGDVLRSPPAPTPIQPGRNWVQRATRIADEEKARSIAQARAAGVSAHNNRFDAERHARWTYRMAKELGPTIATIAGIGHEIGNIAHFEPLGEALMDLHNNGVGIGHARTPCLVTIRPQARYPGEPE